jgi:predicted adenylyl cyclase CyaB
MSAQVDMEIEAKLKVTDHKRIREKLTEHGGHYVSRVKETNHIFDKTDRSLLASDQGLRVRVCRNEQGQQVSATLTYKGPRLAGEHKKREELQTMLDDPEATRSLLQRLGFVEFICFEKWRETWQLHGGQVELDELPYLGHYVEIEADDEERIRRIQKDLGLGSETHLRDTYIHMLVDYCRDRDVSLSHIAFS